MPVKRFTAVLMLCVLCGFAIAANLGVVGETFPVAELSFMLLIESRLQEIVKSGEMAAIEKEWVSRVSDHANRPTPIGLKRAFKNNTYRYEPIIVLSQDILNAAGLVLWAKGTRVNPLNSMPTYQPHWLLLDGDDLAQVRWARRMLHHHNDAKVILTGGEVGKIEQALNQPIYFDQAGRISHQLGIRRVPALVSREGNALRIMEVAIREDGSS
ncbi:MAG: type-F conjugative transfer system protein TraW [Legionellaceae bacterium]|nr:type-F conjugative transfer system protein TraW [Legionellaceae bacterium]